tara:strand:+ start:26080 stop:26412 length:333 start_codon:yes stop_codon:yes gene_type:complete
VAVGKTRVIASPEINRRLERRLGRPGERRWRGDSGESEHGQRTANERKRDSVKGEGTGRWREFVPGTDPKANTSRGDEISRIFIRITGVQASTRKVTIAPEEQGMETYIM